MTKPKTCVLEKRIGINKPTTPEELDVFVGNRCPRCGNESLKECVPASFLEEAFFLQRHYSCLLLCGMSFGLSRLKDGLLYVFYNTNNEKYILEMFNIKKNLK